MSDKDDRDTDRAQRSPMRDQRNDKTETNPFDAFRRFADEQVSSVLQSITAPPNPDRWTIFTDDHSYKSMAYRHRQGANDKPPESDSSDRSAENPRDGAGRGPSPGANDPQASSSSPNPKQLDETNYPHSSQSLHRLNDHAFFSHPFLHAQASPSFLSIPGFLTMFDEDSSPLWPLPYLITSPYSPLHLSARLRIPLALLRASYYLEADFREPQWREAFEDLLRLENGEPMLDRDHSLVAATKNTENGAREWLQGLAKRGSLGKDWMEGGRMRLTLQPARPWLSIGAPHDHAEEENQEAETELDLYDRFLNDLQSLDRQLSKEFASSPILRFLLGTGVQPEQPHELSRSQHGSNRGYDQGTDDTESWLDLVSGGNRKSVPENPPPGEMSRPNDTDAASRGAHDLIATRTHTEQIMQPDGSIQTKKVVTRRYADGKEETHSSVEVSHVDPKSREAWSDAAQEQPKRGWFWRD
ncbi:hypothetical protein N7470_006024 [Penicillium chermesinum]|nr:hypothetical protein N7470_006024 [Penicillium chermesinum]